MVQNVTLPVGAPSEVLTVAVKGTLSVGVEGRLVESLFATSSTLEGEATSAAVDFATRIRDAADALVKTPTAAAVREAHETIVTWSPAGT